MNEDQEAESSGGRVGEDDEVVRKIPTYISKLDGGKLYLIQHPLKPAVGSSSELLKFSEVKYKPPYEKFQFSVPLDPKSAFYDKDKGETLGAKVASMAGADPEEILEERPKFDHLTLEGTPLPKPTGSARYAIAIVKKDQIHLCPLKDIVQVKPTFEYLNKVESRKGGGDGIDTNSEDEGTDEVTKVTVKFARSRDRDPAAKDDQLRPKSYATLMREMEEHPWTTLDYEEYDPSHMRILETREAENPPDISPLEPRVYMEMLFPKYKEVTYEVASEKKASSSTRTPISLLKQMSLGDQVKTLMRNGVVLRFHDIREFLRIKLKVVVEDMELIRTLQTAANVIHGNWVVRSDLVYSANYVSSAHGISRDVMQSSRDLILTRYVESRVLERKKMCSLTRLPVEEITEILQPIARKVPREGWEFKLPDDTEFISRFPDVIKIQEQVWERKKKQKLRKVSETGAASTAGPGNQRRRSRTKSVSSDADSGTEDRRAGGGGRQRRTSTRSNHVEP